MVNRLIEKFNGLRWGPVTPEYLNCKNAEVLFIGEGGKGEEEAEEVVEELEEEDKVRVGKLKGKREQNCGI